MDSPSSIVRCCGRSPAITTVAAGQAQLDPAVQRRLLEALSAGAPAAVTPVGGEFSDDVGLTHRDVDVLRHIADGGSNNTEIADRLCVCEATVKTHVSHLLAKTGCRDRAALVAYHSDPGGPRTGEQPLVRPRAGALPRCLHYFRRIARR